MKLKHQKRMKTLQFKALVVFVFVFITSINAQKLDKKYTEHFNVNGDVVIDVNARYTDIEIETWNKNEVLIEAYIIIEGDYEQKVIDDYLKSWNFEALGNKKSIKITSKSSGLLDIHSINFDSPNYERLYTTNIQNSLENLQYVLPEIQSSLRVLDTMHFEFPEMPEMPEMPEIETFLFDFDNSFHDAYVIEKFDFEKYKKDKNYLKEWKERNKEALKGGDVKVSNNSISISIDRDEVSKEELEKRMKELKIRQEVRQKELQERMKERQEELKVRNLELKERLEKTSEERKLALVKRQEALAKRHEELAKSRVEIRDILVNRERVKIKRVLKIKAPKGAKFNMDVKYGSMSFPK
tara:strand:- start:118417 stop:119478 length:1062 start_codon:yes stop_codon:yes gene_type:complete